MRPGKDVTLYVPSDTPLDVCDYLNSLKEQGMFSSGVIEIITNYVQNNLHVINQDANEITSTFAVPELVRESRIHSGAPASIAYLPGNEEETSPLHEVQPAVKRRLSLSEIFSQAKKNSLDEL